MTVDLHLRAAGTGLPVVILHFGHVLATSAASSRLCLAVEYRAVTRGH